MMNEKQIYRRMNECFESDYKMYDDEAEWYRGDDPKEWKFYIPSEDIDVRLTLDEANKRVLMEESKSKGEFRYAGYYYWG